MKVDLHTHILPAPDRWPDWAARFGHAGWIRLREHKPCCAQMLVGDRVFREIQSNCWDPVARLREMDSLGGDTGGPVRLQVLSTVPVMFGYGHKPDETRDVSRWLNDELATVVRTKPDRFVGLGTLPMQDPQAACRELERCRGELGMPGVQIGTHVNRWNLDERELRPVFETAERLGACIFVHPWDMMGAADMPRYWLPWLVGMPAESSRAICSVIFGGVLEQFPKLRLCFAHGGGSFPGTIGRIAHGHACRPDLVAVDNPRPPREYLADPARGTPARFYVDSLVHDADVLRALIGLMGASRVALGTDYPFPLGEECPGALICSLAELSDAVRARLLGGTALEFLGRG